MSSARAIVCYDHADDAVLAYEDIRRYEESGLDEALRYGCIQDAERRGAALPETEF